MPIKAMRSSDGTLCRRWALAIGEHPANCTPPGGAAISGSMKLTLPATVRAEGLKAFRYFARRIFARAMWFFSSTNTSFGSKFSSSLIS